MRHYRFWSSSLLWVFDGGSLDSSARLQVRVHQLSLSSFQSLDVRMIDFANTIVLKDNPSPDEEYLFGLGNLIAILESLTFTSVGREPRQDHNVARQKMESRPSAAVLQFASSEEEEEAPGDALTCLKHQMTDPQIGESQVDFESVAQSSFEEQPSEVTPKLSVKKARSASFCRTVEHNGSTPGPTQDREPDNLASGSDTTQSVHFPISHKTSNSSVFPKRRHSFRLKMERQKLSHLTRWRSSYESSLKPPSGAPRESTRIPEKHRLQRHPDGSNVNGPSSEMILPDSTFDQNSINFSQYEYNEITRRPFLETKRCSYNRKSVSSPSLLSSQPSGLGQTDTDGQHKATRKKKEKTRDGETALGAFTFPASKAIQLGQSDLSSQSDSSEEKQDDIDPHH